MSATRIPMGRLAVVAALGVAIWAIAQGGRGVHWRTLTPGIEFTMLRGEPYCRRGSAEIALLRLDPARVRLRVRHYARDGEKTPPSIVGWQAKRGALAVFNAGQYYPDYSYMGLMVSDGEVVSGRMHPNFKAALVASPEDGSPKARVLDLEREPLDAKQPGWREVAQSFMLFDHGGALRVRTSERVANRTAVAEDEHGRIVVCVTEGGYTLSDFATLLKGARLGLGNAMSMDGGYEAEMCVVAGGFRYASFGHWTGDSAPEAPGAQVPLPAVIEVSARSAK